MYKMVFCGLRKKMIAAVFATVVTALGAALPAYAETINNKAVEEEALSEEIAEEIILEETGEADIFNISDDGKHILSLTEAGKKLAVINVPEGIEQIDFQTFYNNEVVEEVTLPKSLKKIDSSAFEGATKLKSINLKEVEEIGAYAFKGCESLLEADISSVELMNLATFEGCTSLETVDFSNVERFNYNVFKDCTSLKNISKFNSKIMTIQPYMFQNCGLTEVRLPYTIKRIGAYAFDGCAELKDIYIYRNADLYEASCDPSQRYWPSGNGVTVHCVRESVGEKFAKGLDNTIDYMSATPVEKMDVIREDGGDSSNVALKTGDSSDLFIIDLAPEYCNQAVSYTTSDSSIAYVSAINDDEDKAYGRYNFRIRGVNKAGNAKVTVKCGDFTHEINVTVGIQASGIVAKSMDLRYGGDGTEGIKLLPGDELKIETKVEPAEAIQAVTFESLNPEVATVTDTGVVKAVSVGTTSVRIKTTDGSNVYRDIKVFVPYVVEINDASDIHCKRGDEGWLNFEYSGYDHPGIVWRYTPKKPGSEQIVFTFQGALGKSGWLAICYGDGTEAANCSMAKSKDEGTIAFYHASVYRKEIDNNTINVYSKPFAIYYSFGDPSGSDGFSVSSFKEYGKTHHISYEGNSYGQAGNNPYIYEIGDVIILENPTREGYEFQGWFLDGNKLQIGEDGKSILDTKDCTGDITLIAKWKGTLVVPPAKLRIKGGDGTYTEYESSEAPIKVEKGTRVELQKDSWECDLFYTIDGSVPDRDSNIYRGGITIDQDTTIKAIVYMPGQEPSLIAQWQLKVEEPELYLGDVKIEDVNEQFDGDVSRIPHGLWIAGYKKEVPYTGAKITFDNIRVYDYKTLLSSTSDYKLTYKNNQKVFTYNQSDKEFNANIAPQIIIAGKGNYATSKAVFFKIMPRDISTGGDSATYVSDITLAATGKGQKPVPSVKWNNKILKAKTDFTYEYRDSAGKTIDELKEAGDYKLVINACGSYTGKVESPIKVIDTKETGITLISSLKAPTLPAQEYKPDGYSKKDIYDIFAISANNISIKNGNDILKIGIDSNDKNGQYYIKDVIGSDKPGNATVIIAATNGSGFAGSKEIKLVIKGTPLSKATVYFINDGKQYASLTAPYTGDVVEPKIQLLYPVSKTEYKELNPVTDYEVSYSNNVAAGKNALLTITGKGAYTGSIKKKFTIAPYDVMGVEAPKISIRFLDAENEKNYHYAKPAVIPELEVVYSFTDNKGIQQKYILKKGTDYTVAYKNNKQVGYDYSTDSKGNSIAPTAVVTLKGSYNGKMSKTFNIEPCNMAEISVVAADKVAANKANAWKSSVTLLDKNGQKLVANKDYDAKNISYYYAKETEVSLIGGGKALREAGESVNSNDVLPVGTHIRVDVSSGTSTNYSGWTRGIYKIISAEYDLSKATVKIINKATNSDKYYYTGSEVRPDKKDIHVYVKSSGKEIEVESSNFMVQSYSKNIKSGKASLVIKGIGQYGGTKTATYTIAGKSFFDNWFKK